MIPRKRVSAFVRLKGKPVSTRRVVARGHAFPDHALAVPTAERRGSTRDAPVDGVSHLVTNGDSSAAVPDGAVHALRARKDDKAFVKMDFKPTLFACFSTPTWLQPLSQRPIA
jgi:hypothetical protein